MIATKSTKKASHKTLHALALNLQGDVSLVKPVETQFKPK